MTPRSFPGAGHLYDIAVVGSGLAGSELAYQLAGRGKDVLLITQSLDTIGNVFDSHVHAAFPETSMLQHAREQALPETGLWAFHRHVKQHLELCSGIHLLQSCVTGMEQAEYWTLSTWEGIPRHAKTVVLAVGSFLGAKLHLGSSIEDSGRMSEVAYDFLYQDLKAKNIAFETTTVSAASQVLPYHVCFQVLTDVDGFAVQGFQGLYALGQCTKGTHSYSSVVQDALDLAGQLA